MLLKFRQTSGHSISAVINVRLLTIKLVASSGKRKCDISVLAIIPRHCHLPINYVFVFDTLVDLAITLLFRPL